MLRWIYALALTVIFFFGAAFALSNAQPVVLRYYVGMVEVPLSLALVLTLGIGVLLGVLAGTAMILRQRRQISRCKRSLALAEEEILQLRNPAGQELPQGKG